MSITAVTAIAAQEPFTHHSWCQLDRCVIDPGESVIHRHVIGQVARIEVTVEQIQDYDRDGRLRSTPVEVFTYSNGDAGMSFAQVDELRGLLTSAGLFVAEVTR